MACQMSLLHTEMAAHPSATFTRACHRMQHGREQLQERRRSVWPWSDGRKEELLLPEVKGSRLHPCTAGSRLFDRMAT